MLLVFPLVLNFRAEVRSRQHAAMPGAWIPSGGL